MNLFKVKLVRKRDSQDYFQMKCPHRKSQGNNDIIVTIIMIPLTILHYRINWIRKNGPGFEIEFKSLFVCYFILKMEKEINNTHIKSQSPCIFVWIIIPVLML